MTPSLRASIKHIVSTLSVRRCWTLRVERASTKFLDLQIRLCTPHSTKLISAAIQYFRTPIYSTLQQLRTLVSAQLDETLHYRYSRHRRLSIAVIYPHNLTEVEAFRC